MKKITLANLKNMSMEEIQGLKESDSDAVRDVTLTLENNSIFYNWLKTYIISTQKKIEKGNYNYSLAVKGMLNLTDKGTKEFYMKDFCNNTNLNSLLNVNDRIIVARDILDNNIGSQW